MLLLNISGPINAGKSTVSKLLSKALNKCLFIKVDDLLDDIMRGELTFDERIRKRMSLLAAKTLKEKQEKTYDTITFA